MRSILFPIALAAIAVLTGAMVAEFTPAKMLIFISAAVIFMTAFIKIDWGLYILIFSMLLSPEFLAGDTTGSSLGRGVTLRLEDLLLVLIGLSWFARNAVMKELGLFLKTPLNTPILFYMLACVLSTGLGVMAGRVELKTGALFLLKYLEYFIVYFMMANHVRNSAQLKRFVFCLFLTAFIVAIIGMFQIPGGQRVSAPFEGPIGEPNTFGGYLLFIGMVAAGLAAKIRERRSMNLLILLIVCMLPPFFFTQSRSSYLAFVPALMIFGFLTERRLIVVGLLSVGLIVSPLFLPEIVKQRILYTFNQPEEPGQIIFGEIRLDTSTSARLQSWQDAARDFTKHPFLGYGITGHGFIDAQVPRVLTETGLLGLATFIYLLFSVFKLAFQRLRQAEDPFFKGLLMGFIAGFAGLVVHSLGTNTFILVRIMEPFWFFTGIIAVLPMIRDERAALPDSSGRPMRATLLASARLSPLRLISTPRPGKKPKPYGRVL